MRILGLASLLSLGLSGVALAGANPAQPVTTTPVTTTITIPTVGGGGGGAGGGLPVFFTITVAPGGGFSFNLAPGGFGGVASGGLGGGGGLGGAQGGGPGGGPAEN
jgi:hypothetical protein